MKTLREWAAFYYDHVSTNGIDRMGTVMLLILNVVVAVVGIWCW